MSHSYLETPRITREGGQNNNRGPVQIYEPQRGASQTPPPPTLSFYADSYTNAAPLAEPKYDILRNPGLNYQTNLFSPSQPFIPHLNNPAEVHIAMPEKDSSTLQDPCHVATVALQPGQTPSMLMQAITSQHNQHYIPPQALVSHLHSTPLTQSAAFPQRPPTTLQPAASTHPQMITGPNFHTYPSQLNVAPTTGGMNYHAMGERLTLSSEHANPLQVQAPHSFIPSHQEAPHYGVSPHPQVVVPNSSLKHIANPIQIHNSGPACTPFAKPTETSPSISTKLNLPPTTFGSFKQTHQVKNVQTFTGGVDGRMLVEDWIRDMQYLLDAIELPVHLRFATVVRHLSGEARKLILNLPSCQQTPEMAFEELRAEYGDTHSSLDPLADFYERGQKAGESACSYAIALEAILRAVEESQHEGRPFPDRDSKLTRQFLRGLVEEEVYLRIAPMKSRLLSFKELQAELRNLSRENKKFLMQHKAKKVHTQVQVAPQTGSLMRSEGARRHSELTEMNEMIRQLTVTQQEQMTRLARLETKLAPLNPPRPNQRPPRFVPPVTSVICHRCGGQGHIARVCRATFQSSNFDNNPPSEPANLPEANATSQSQPLNY